MSDLTPYLCVSDARAAIEWYAAVFGAVVTFEPIVMPDNRIGHVELSFDHAVGGAGGGGGARIMMSDEFDDAGVASPMPGRGNDVSLHLTVSDVDALAVRITDAGVVLDRGPQDTDHGRVAVLRDPFGHRWFLNQPS